MSSVIAIVKSIVGQVLVVSPGGARRVVVEGDRIYQGEQLLTSPNGAVTLDVGEGKLVDLGRDSRWSARDLTDVGIAPPPGNASSVSDLHKAITAGIDPTVELTSTSAGQQAGSSTSSSATGGGSHSFVMLTETAGHVAPTIGYPTAGLDFAAQNVEHEVGLEQENLAPEFIDDTGQKAASKINLMTKEDTPLNGTFLAQDPNGDAFTFHVGDAPQNGQLMVSPDGTWQYTPNPDYNGEDTFTVVVTDSHGSSSSTTVNIGITPVNDIPVAQSGTATTDENTVLHGQVPPASDVDGHVTGYQVTTGVGTGNGTLSFNPDGSYSFDPGTNFDHLAPGQSQDVTFTYQAKDNDGALSDPQAITITVTGTNDMPIAHPGTATTDEDTILNGHVPPATDVDGHVTGYQLTTDVSAGNGALTFNPDGSYSFAPGTDFDHLAPGQTQDVTFTYQAKDNDGGLSTPQIITITVSGTNDAPIAYADTASTEENTVLNAQVPVGTDVDGTVTSYQLTTDVGSGNGTLTFNPDGSYSFNPGTDFDSLASGETRDVTFTYQAKDNDGALSDPQSVTITVTGTNDAAVIAGQTSGSTDETNAPVTISGQLTVTDVDSPASFQPQSNVAGTYGHFSLGTDGAWSYVANDAYNALQVGQSLTDTFSVQSVDGTTSSVTVTINGTNDAPIAYAGTASTEENAVLNAQVPAGTDVDGTVTSYQLTTDVGSGNGTLTFNPDGSYSFNPGTDFDSLASGETRDVTFTYQAKDNDGALSDPQSVTITVTGTNDAAVIAGQTSGSTDETNAPVTISGQLTVTDVDSPASFQPQSNVAGTYGHFSLGTDGAWSYVANDAYNALQVGQSLTDTFSVQSVDGTTSSVTVTINGTNDAPIAYAGTASTEENAVLNAQVPAGTDVDGTVTSYQLTTDVGSGNGTLTFNPDGSYSFNPGTDFDSLALGETRDVTFTYQAKDNDGALSDPQSVTITVTGTNDAAVIAGQTSGSTDETNAPVTISGQLTVTDVDSPASFQPQSNVAGTYGHFSLGTDGAWSYVANDAYNALQVGQSLTDTFSVQSVDGTTSSVTVTINGTNDAPIAYAGTASTEENAVLNAQVPAGTDVDGTVTSYQLTTDVGSGNGTLTFNPDGSYSFNPGTDFDSLALGETRDVTFTYQAKDNDGALSDPQAITITVSGTNDAPIAVPDLANTKEDTTVQINVLGNDRDPDGDPLTVTSASATNGVVAINPDGTLTYTPKSNFSGTETITYTVADSSGGTASSTVTVTVEAVADQPTLSFSSSNDHPAATGLTVESWTGLPLGTSGNGANPATLQSVIDNAGAPYSSHSIDTVYDPTVPAGTANKVSGLIFLEAGHSYTFGGQGDDSIRLLIGGNVIGQSTWGANSGYFNGTFTPSVTGYYTLDLYQHNQNEAGSYVLAMSDNGTNAHVVSSATNLVYHNAQELIDSGERISDLVGSNGEGYYAAYGTNEGDEDTIIPLSHINAALVDTDGSETLSVSIGNIPAGATLSDGTHSFTADATHDSIDVTQWNLNSLTFIPPANANGTVTLAVSATATETSNLDASTRTQNLDITVHAVNDAPTAAPTQHLTTNENTPASGQVIANDVDDDSLSYAVKNGNGPSHGIVVMGNDGHFVYTPAANYAGSDSFTLSVSDGHGGSVEQVVSLDIASTNTLATPYITDSSVFALMPGAVSISTTQQIDPAVLEEEAGLTTGQLDEFNPPPGALTNDGTVDVIDGAITSSDYHLQAGTAIHFDWTFINGEFDATEITFGFNDIVALVVTDPSGAKQIVQVTSSEQLGASVNGSGVQSYTATVNGNYHFDWLVLNGGDNEKDSSLSIASTHLTVAGQPYATPVTLALTTGLTQSDSSQSLTLKISGVPSDAALTAGNKDADGHWTLSETQLHDLQLLPAVGFTGTLDLTVTATASDSEGHSASSSAMLSVTIAKTGSTIATDGNDFIQQLDGNDVIHAGDGHDLVYGGGGADSLYGGDGNDVLHGGMGNDQLFGESGNDLLLGGHGDDWLNGGDGNDVLIGGKGNDTLIGGTGSDTFLWHAGDTGDKTISDFNVQEGDRLDLSDLLPDAAHNDILSYLKVDTATSTLQVSTSGHVDSSSDVSIKLTGVDLSAYGNTSAEIVNKLVAGSDPVVRTEHH